MPDNHSHSSSSCRHTHGAPKHSKALYTAMTLAFLFMVVEVIGGYVANSLALISDALHMFTDVGALSLSLIVLRIAHWPRTPEMSYGYQRAEVLGALASALSLWVLCGVLVYEAIQRLFTPQPVQGSIVFVIASIGLLANLMMMKVLHSGQGENINVRAAYLHVLGDLLGSVGVILSGAILFWTGWNPIDPIITILFSLAIVYGSGKIIAESVSILMESTPPGFDPIAIEKDLLLISGVKEVHDLHIWAVSPQNVSFSAHLIAENTNGALSEAHLLLQTKYNIRHMTIQVEDPEHFESQYCYDCDKNSSKN
ncbi:MAG: cation diffusion facilitator family transporter [Rhabdochlamydiaceae bacterium]|nr:cation diffusion facilitator family transporter [Rhabdochlamydiaceae bacterium]